ncbi:MAG: glycosyltransferase involved in cell wall biosynthesis [Cocleimonas sp.]|jgi:glycosyltransferase involved in cell wall biosynthesis
MLGKHKLCIWMNIPSHHQSGFFDALFLADNVSIEVRYFHAILGERSQEGWSSSYEYREFEKCIQGIEHPEEMLKTVPDANERIHLISASFSPELVSYFCEHKIKWCHWSEMPGIRLVELLNYKMSIFRLLNPLMLLLKCKEGQRISQFAVGAFGQGILAQRSFRCMGVPKQKLANLFYVPIPLIQRDAALSVNDFSKGRRVFLSVAALCKRKGIDILLKSFAQLRTKDWCLVLCGLDKADGVYQKLTQSLGIQDQVLFLGAYPVDRIAEVYVASDVFILPSRFDGWGAVLNEAASVGLPLIGTDLCGASWHVIKPGLNGFRVSADSVKLLKKAMQNYVDNSELIAVHGKHSKEVFFNEFTPQKNVERICEAIASWTAKK